MLVHIIVIYSTNSLGKVVAVPRPYIWSSRVADLNQFRTGNIGLSVPPVSAGRVHMQHAQQSTAHVTVSPAGHIYAVSRSPILSPVTKERTSKFLRETVFFNFDQVFTRIY
jgi:hypothetical protein